MVSARCWPGVELRAVTLVPGHGRGEEVASVAHASGTLWLAPRDWLVRRGGGEAEVLTHAEFERQFLFIHAQLDEPHHAEHLLGACLPAIPTPAPTSV